MLAAVSISNGSASVSISDLEDELAELSRVRAESERLVGFLSSLSAHMEKLTSSTDAAAGVLERWENIFAGRECAPTSNDPEVPIVTADGVGIESDVDVDV